MDNQFFLICGGLFLLFVGLGVLSFFANIIGMFFDVINIVVGVASMGPIPGCGCLALVLGCGCFASVAYVWLTAMETCGTDQAMNFCRFLGG
jgi:hypothetical protein